MYETIDYASANGVLTITLNRPERLNAFTPQMRDELLDALERADDDDAVRVIVFTGAGRGYCAGADLGAGAATFGGQVWIPGGADQAAFGAVSSNEAYAP